MADFLRAQFRTIAQIAGRQYGLITTAELRAAGLSRDTIAAWVDRGFLFRVHRGIYRVGHVSPSTEADYLAAVLACQPAYLAGRACASNYRVAAGRPAPPEIVAAGKKDRPTIITRRAKLH